jgi:hypothetical protein
MQFSKLTQTFQLACEVAKIPVLHAFQILKHRLIFLTEYESVSRIRSVLKLQG